MGNMIDVQMHHGAIRIYRVMNISILLIISVDSKVVIVIIEPTTDC